MKSKNKFFRTLGEILLVSLIVIGCRYQHQPESEAAMTMNDSTIHQAIGNEFEVQPAVSTENLEWRVEDGIVTLAGTADNLLEKDEAAEISSMIRGVKGVINLIDVKSEPVSDEELMNRIGDILYEDPALESYKIRVEPDSGLVNLYGRVETWNQKDLASDLVKMVDGVREINNELAFRYDSARDEFDLKRDITSALRNDIRVDDGLIEVEVKGGIAYLTGTVGSSAEKSIAFVHSFVPGIDSVNAEGLEVSADERDPYMRKDKYVRKSDAEIIAAVQQAFLQDPRLLNHDIKLTSDSGHVVLRGTVSNLRAKKAAAEDVSNIVGVWSVKNNIDVDEVGFPTENVVADQVSRNLDYHPYLSQYSIDPEWQPDGTVVLTGQVDYAYEKTAAEEVASRVLGVVEIKNKIEVTQGIEIPYTLSPDRMEDLPTVKNPMMKSDEQLMEDVSRQLWWSPFVDRNQIELEVDRGEVTLSGTVNTRSEMEYAVRNAYEGGAIHVVNKLKVDFWEL